MPLSETELVLRIGAAAILGGVIGYERERREQPAGLRTHLLVALAAATFMIVSSQFAFYQHYDNEALVRVDPGRIASNVVVGIGFLGGGAIMHFGLQVKGLTTAASLWLVASVGLAAGSGMYMLAMMVTGLTLFALVALRYVIEAPRKLIVRLRVRLEIEGKPPTRSALRDYIRPAGAMLLEVDFQFDLPTNCSRMNLEIKLPDETHEDPLVTLLEQFPGALRVRVKRIDT